MVKTSEVSTRDPIALFQVWLSDAQASGELNPTAMSLATVDAEQRPSVRMVLLKHADERGFVFYTNLDSPKAQDLQRTPRAALCFYWANLDRQVRAEGPVEPVTEAEADAYFASRPRLSQLGAWASKQSQPINGYWELEKAVAGMALRFPVGTVPRPPFWSGFRLKPEKIEFWRQKPFRQHERYTFVREPDGSWREQWLFP